MQYTLPALAAILGLIASTHAVFVCDGFNANEHACTGNCPERHIGVNEVINIPNTQRLFNSDHDGGFDGLVCSGPNLQGGCTYLHDLPRTDITGDFNWETPGTGSFLRTGN